MWGVGENDINGNPGLVIGADGLPLLFEDRDSTEEIIEDSQRRFFVVTVLMFIERVTD